MTVLVLDTTVLIDSLRGRPVLQRMQQVKKDDDTAATTAINIEEVVSGLRSNEVPAARLLIRGLLVLPIDTDAAWQSGEWRRDFASRGTTLHQADCLVAAIAHQHGARLCTGNPKHFPMPELIVEHWPVGQ